MALLKHLLLPLVLSLSLVPCNRALPHGAATTQFTGVILDVYSGRIPKVSVLIEGANQKWNLESDDEGEFKLDLPEGKYQFTLDKPHFKRLRVLDFNVAGGPSVNHEFKLEVGECNDCDWIVRDVNEKPRTYGYEIKNVFPHDRAAFTQGLIYKDGILWESTGQYGSSSLRKVELKTGKVLKTIPVPREFFAEGMTVFRDRVFQLTWQNNKGFIYSPADFAKTGEFKYAGEGWGLTHDSDSLIMSDGTSQIRFLDPETFAVRRTISVTEDGRPLDALNELEYVKGEIYANVWQTDRIVRIDPKTGHVTGAVDLAGLLPEADRDADTDVLNGIAYEEATDRLFVTGKLWPKLFEIRLVKK